ncbi:hypothetical protein ALP58_101138 [Pseudomonas savastanoi]|nr:hypothetical protein ALO79_100204 [Pseudomonas syringae pv. castaneae]RMS82424.1 hypothetical protein ALP58_101138 [Pseudomonas savastanoi]
MTCNATLPAIWLTTFIARSIVGFVESLSATRANEDAMLVRLIICFPGNSLSSLWQATGSGSTGESIFDAGLGYKAHGVPFRPCKR